MPEGIPSSVYLRCQSPHRRGRIPSFAYTPGRELQTGKALPGLKRRGGTRTSSVSRIFVEPYPDDSDREEIFDRTKLCRDEQRTLPFGGTSLASETLGPFC
jgi:hypothetical protein